MPAQKLYTILVNCILASHDDTGPVSEYPASLGGANLISVHT